MIWLALLTDDPGSGPDLGLWAAALLGLTLVVASVWLRGRGKLELRPTDVALGAVPFLLWLLASGQVSKLGFAGVEVEVRDAILAATSEPVAGQVTTVEGVVDRIEGAERGPKGGEDLLPRLVQQRIEALEFRLGRGGYYVGSVIARYLETLCPQPFFRYVLVFDEQGRLFGMFDKATLLATLQQEESGYDRFAALLNRGGETSGNELASLAGFVPGTEALTPTESKRLALTRMETLDCSALPVVDPETRKFLGVVERDRLTASLILDIAGGLERTD